MKHLMLCAALALPSTVLAQPEAAPVIETVVAQPTGELAVPVTTSTVIPAALPDVVEEISAGGEVDWAVATVGVMRAAASERLWGPFASVVIMALLSLFSFVFLRWRDLRTSLRPYMGEVALAVSVLGYVALGLSTLPVEADLGAWWAVIGPGIKTGLAAIGGYELIVKRLLKHWAPKLWALVKRLVG